jgi:hypothetical protein
LLHASSVTVFKISGDIPGTNVQGLLVLCPEFVAPWPGIEGDNNQLLKKNKQ